MLGHSELAKLQHFCIFWSLPVPLHIPIGHHYSMLVCFIDPWVCVRLEGVGKLQHFLEVSEHCQLRLAQNSTVADGSESCCRYVQKPLGIYA